MVLPVAHRRRLERGEVLFRQGDEAAFLFTVEAGRVRLLRQTVEGATVPVATARGGEMLAEAALFTDVYHCDAIAERPSRVLTHDKRRVLAAITAGDEVGLAFCAQLARQVRGLRTRLELRHVRSARERILAWLALEPAAASGDRPLRELAEDVGVAPEVLYRTLKDLEREGRISRQGRRIELAET